MATLKLVDIVAEDIHNCLAENKELLYNERDLQMHLAIYLKGLKSGDQPKYKDVDVEYYVPYDIFGKEYIWTNELKIDIVVSDGEEYCPVELKYKTKAVDNEPDLIRFGVNIIPMMPKGKVVQILKDQSAQDLGMYDFWKDVRRVELLKRKFHKVQNGLCVFMTNDKQYLGEPRATSNNNEMSMSEGNHSSSRHWQNPKSASEASHPSFNLNSEYLVHWEKVEVKAVAFFYTIVTI